MLRLRPILRSHGVTEQQWRVLRTLANSEGLEATQLARAVFLLRPSLTRILRDLQTRGLVGRRVTGSSLRRSVVTITPKGLALIAEAAPQAARANAAAKSLGPLPCCCFVSQRRGAPRRGATPRANAEIDTLIGPADLAELKRVLFRIESALKYPPRSDEAIEDERS